MSATRCGYAIEDADGNQNPCDRPATGWRWYQDVGEHEDTLEVACAFHANDGGDRLYRAETERRMALEMHDVQFERANRVTAERDHARTIAARLEGELAELRKRVERLISDKPELRADEHNRVVWTVTVSELRTLIEEQP